MNKLAKPPQRLVNWVTEQMLRREFFTCMAASSLAVAARAAEAALQGVRGKLSPGPKPTVAGESGSMLLSGDSGTMLVLGDQRLSGLDLEALGTQDAGVFKVGSLYKRSMFVHQGDKRLMITYWCTVCSIRTFTPGPCMCCQEETAVDLVEKLESDDLRAR